MIVTKRIQAIALSQGVVHDGMSPITHTMTPLRIQIRELRESKGWTQGQLAEEAAVTRATVNRLENGKTSSIDLTVLERLAKALGVAPGLLIVEGKWVSSLAGAHEAKGIRYGDNAGIVCIDSPSGEVLVHELTDSPVAGPGTAVAPAFPDSDLARAKTLIAKGRHDDRDGELALDFLRRLVPHVESLRAQRVALRIALRSMVVERDKRLCYYLGDDSLVPMPTGTESAVRSALATARTVGR
jgi:transcriptional regulator with XRE-family HTH domain